jgi:hypothetical protein
MKKGNMLAKGMKYYFDFFMITCSFSFYKQHRRSKGQCARLDIQCGRS